MRDVESDVGIWIEYIEKEDRSYPIDIFKVCQHGGTCWVSTFQQLLEFKDDLQDFLNDAIFENYEGRFNETQ